MMMMMMMMMDDDDGQRYMWQKSLAALFVEKKCHSGFSFAQKNKNKFFKLCLSDGGTIISHCVTLPVAPPCIDASHP
jgi:hypothetical protein